MMIKNILSKSGFEVVGEAENGLLAVEKYRALQPDIVTMDMVMPDMDGISAVKAIVAEFPNAKIIMCTSMGQQALVVEAIPVSYTHLRAHETDSYLVCRL